MTKWEMTLFWEDYINISWGHSVLMQTKSKVSGVDTDILAKSITGYGV